MLLLPYFPARRQGHIQVGDFGLATFREGGSDDDQSVVGTPHYMSPELLSKKAYSFKSDIWCACAWCR